MSEKNQGSDEGALRILECAGSAEINTKSASPIAFCQASAQFKRMHAACQVEQGCGFFFDGHQVIESKPVKRFIVSRSIELGKLAGKATIRTDSERYLFGYRNRISSGMNFA
jgi:hypothetical protein